MENNKKIFKIVIAILIVVVIGIIGYVVYDKYNNSKVSGSFVIEGNGEEFDVQLDPEIINGIQIDSEI